MSELPDRGPISRSSPSSAAAASRDSRELLPEPNAMVSHLRKMVHWAASLDQAQRRRQQHPRWSRCPQRDHQDACASNPV